MSRRRTADYNRWIGSKVSVQSLFSMADQRKYTKLAGEEPTSQVPSGCGNEGTEPETATLQFDPREATGGTIGPYKLLDELGAGGMGTVYLAEQEKPVRRRVAVKVIKQGLDTAQVIARFEAERQALALMDHPNIARILDAGMIGDRVRNEEGRTPTPDTPHSALRTPHPSGRPYFVMELVQGAPITKYCDTHRVTLRERLELFLPVCRAVLHAHQKGIIHRDLKPSNILVTLRDEKPVPKIIDFGIAKATTQRLTERTLYTQHGQLVGTPDYMSPEQAGLGGLDVDTRSDVYSLGAVLYELLCGETPFGHARLKQLDFVTMLNVIYEEDPPSLSRRVTALGAKAGDVARCRDVEPQKLTQSLRGELDWIVTKALEKERTRRYESASALAADIERYLADQPVEAGPPSKTYRLQKFVRRNRAALAATAMIALALIGGIIASTWQAYRATQAERSMNLERQAALDAKADADSARKLAEEQGTQLAAALAQANDAAIRERAARDEIERRLRVAEAMRLAMQSRDAAGQYPQRALLLAAEAAEATRRAGEPAIPAAQQALRDALDGIGGRPLYNHTLNVNFLKSTPDGKRLITSGNGVRLWDLAAADPARSTTLVGGTLVHQAKAISPEGRWLVTIGGTNTAQMFVWDLHARQWEAPAKTLDFPEAASVNHVSFSADARWIMATSFERAWLFDLAADGPTPRRVVIAPEDDRLGTLAVSAANRWAITYESHRSLNLWPLGGDKVAPEPQVLVNEDQGVDKIAVSADGRWLAASGPPGRPWGKLWDLSLPDPFRAPRDISPPFPGYYSRLIFTPDAAHLVAMRADEINLWDLATEDWTRPHVSLSAQQAGRSVEVADVTVGGGSRSRSFIAITSEGTILYWDLTARDPQVSRVVVGRHPGGSGVRLAVSPSGRWLVSSRRNDIPRLWDLSGKNAIAAGLPLPGHDGGAELVAFGGRAPGILDSGERWLVTAGADATPRLWDLAAADPSSAARGLRSFQAYGRDVAPRPDGDWIVATANGARLVDLDSAPDPISAEIAVRSLLSGHRFSNSDVPLSRDGQWLTINHISRVGVWNLADEVLTASASRQQKGALRRLWNLELGGAAAQAAAPHMVLEAQEGDSFQEVVVGPDGRWVCTKSDSRSIRLWPLAEKKSAANPPPIDLGEGDRIPVFSPDGRWLVAFSLPPGRMVGRLWNLKLAGPHEVYLWDLHASPPRYVAIDLTQQPYIADGAVTFSDDGRWLAATAGHQVRLWRLGEEGPLGEPEMFGDDSQDQVLFERVVTSRDGRWVAATSTVHPGGGIVNVWDRAAQGPDHFRYELRGHEYPVQAMAFDPDDQWLASASSDGRVRLWNLLAAQPEETSIALRVAADSATNANVTRLTFSGDGKWLAATAADAIHFWPLDLETLLTDAFTLAGRELDTGEIERYRLDLRAVRRGSLLRRAAELGRRLKANPQDVDLLQQRINLLAKAGQFDAAIDDLDLLVRLRPDDHWPQYRRLPLLAHAGKADDYRTGCNAMMKQFADVPPESAEILERVAKGGLFWAESGIGWTEPARFADRAVAIATEHNHWVLPWAQVAKGLAEYRRGNYAQAITWAEMGLADRTRQDVYTIVVPGHLVRALALAAMGQTEAAQSALAEAIARHERAINPVESMSDDWLDWYLCDIMFREAQSALAAKSAPDEMTDVLP